ncbi:hypothetical protein FRC15_009348 [Serendipita sp. 397]|nr:hypothetical protein FRC15_009348 [Serendipita sp. 397]
MEPKPKPNWKFWKKKKSSKPSTSALPTPAPTLVVAATSATAIAASAAPVETNSTISPVILDNQTTQHTLVSTEANSTSNPPERHAPPSHPHVSKTEAWLSRATLFLTFTKSVAEGVGLTPLKAACEGVVTLLEAVQTVQDNRSAWNELVLAIKAHLNTFKRQLGQVGISDILEEVESSLRDPIEEYFNDVTDLLANILAESGITEADIKTNKLTISILVQRIGTTKLEAGVINDYRLRLQTAQSKIMQSLLLYIASSVGNSKDDAVLAKLQFTKPSNISRPRECVKGTRTDILSECKEWSVNEDTPNILWIKGHPGGGKSAIASSLVNELGIKKKRLGSSFFFQRQNATTMTTPALWRTVAYDLARHPTIRKTLATRMKKEEIDLETPNIDVLFQQLIQDSLTKVEDIPIEQSPIVVIDALDECGGLEGQRAKDRKDLIRTLDSWSQLPRNFKLIVTSREESDITRLFSRTQPHTIELSTGEKTDAQSKEDIQSFLRIEFQTIAERYPESLSADWPGSKIIEDLAVKAGGLFIWASTAIKLVEAGEPEEQLKQALSGKGTGDMNGLYVQVINTSFPSPSVQVVQNLLSVVGTVIVAKEPLRLSAVAQLLSIAKSAAEHICTGLQSVMESREELRFRHQSFVDFLLDPGSDASNFSISLGKAHEALASRCLKIMRDELRFNIGNIESSYTLNDEIPGLESRLEKCISPHLLYASRFWTTHLEEVSPSPEVLEDVRYFLRNQFLFWLEVISLHQLVNGGVVILLVLLKWLKRRGLEDLIALASDMPKFITHFNTLIPQSVPHIYLSALPFVSEESWIAKEYGHRYPNTVKIEQGGDRKWSGSLNILSGHSEGVLSVAWSTDGRRVLSGSYDNTVRMWDAETGQQHVSSLEGHDSRVRAMAFSPDGRWVVSGSSDKTLRIWDVETGQQYGSSLEDHHGQVQSVAFSPDGRRIVSGSFDKTVRIWDVETGQQHGPSLVGHDGWVQSVAFSPDGRRIVSGSSDNTVRIWDVETGRQHGPSFKGHDGWVQSVAFSPDGRRIVSGSSDHTVRIWDVETGRQHGPSLEGHNGWFQSVAFSPDGRRIVSGSEDKTVWIWDVETGKKHGPSLEGHNGWVQSVVFSPDGQRIVSGSEDKTVRIWDVEAGQQHGPSLGGHDGLVSSVAFSPDGRRIVSGSYDKTVQIWDLKTGQQHGPSLEGHDGWVQSIAFSPDGRRIVSGSSDKTVRIWDVETGQQHGPSLEGHNDLVQSVAFSPDGRRIVSGSSDHTVRIWNVETGRQHGLSLEGHDGLISSVAFSPDGRWIVSGSYDKTVRIWDVEAGRQHGSSLEGHDGWVQSVAFSTDGRRIVSGSYDKTVRIWDVEAGRQHGSSLEGHDGWVQSVAFSPDGRRIVSGSYDNTVRIWDAETGRQHGSSLEGHNGCVQSVAFSPDSRRIASASDDKTVRIWDVQHAPLLEMSFNKASSLLNASRMTDGWIRGANSERLFWVAPHLQMGLFPPFQTLFIGQYIQTRLDMSKFVHGAAWTQVRGDWAEASA